MASRGCGQDSTRKPPRGARHLPCGPMGEAQIPSHSAGNCAQHRVPDRRGREQTRVCARRDGKPMGANDGANDGATGGRVEA